MAYSCITFEMINTRLEWFFFKFPTTNTIYTMVQCTRLKCIKNSLSQSVRMLILLNTKNRMERKGNVCNQPIHWLNRTHGYQQLLFLCVLSNTTEQTRSQKSLHMTFEWTMCVCVCEFWLYCIEDVAIKTCTTHILPQ